MSQLQTIYEAPVNTRTQKMKRYILSIICLLIDHTYTGGNLDFDQIFNDVGISYRIRQHDMSNITLTNMQSQV